MEMEQLRPGTGDGFLVCVAADGFVGGRSLIGRWGLVISVAGCLKSS